MVIGRGCHRNSEKLTQPTASGPQLAVCGQLLPLAYIWWEALGPQAGEEVDTEVSSAGNLFPLVC